MRVNQYLARHTELSRRSADEAVVAGRVEINGVLAKPGDTVIESDTVKLDGADVTMQENITIMLNKPAGYVVSKNGQGSDTIYDILPSKFKQLSPVGRLDKHSSGLLLLTNNGMLANQLTHPRYQKQKIYHVTVNRKLSEQDFNLITKTGVMLEDGVSQLGLSLSVGNPRNLVVTMTEGRNRQIRRTFTALDYKIFRLHRIQFGQFSLGSLEEKKWKDVTDEAAKIPIVQT